MAENLPPLTDSLDVIGGLNDAETFKYLAENPAVILQDLNYIGDGRSTLEPNINTNLSGFLKTDSEQYLGSPSALPKPKSWPFKESSPFSLLLEKARSTFRDNIYGGDMAVLPQTYSSPASESDSDATFVGDSNSPVEPTTLKPLAATVGTDAAANVALPDLWPGPQATTQEYPTAPSESLLPGNEAEADASAFIGESQPPIEPESAPTPELVEATTTATAVTDSAVDHEHGTNPAAVGEQALLPAISAVTGLPAGVSLLPFLSVYLPRPDYKNMGLPVCTPVPPALLHPSFCPPDYKAVATMNFPVWSCPSLPPYPYNGSHYQPSATNTGRVVNAATNHSQGIEGGRYLLPSVTQPASELAVPGLGNTAQAGHRPYPPAVPAARGRSRPQVNQPNPYPPSGYLPVDGTFTTAGLVERVGNPYPSSSGYVEEGHSLTPPVAPVKAKAPRRIAPMPSRATQDAAHRSTSSSASSPQDGDQVDDDYEGSTTVGKKRKASSKGKEPERAVQHRYPHPKVPGGFTLITKTPQMYVDGHKGIVEEVIAPAGPYQIRFL